MFTFRVPAYSVELSCMIMVKVSIRCELLYAQWLSNHREIFGVYQDGPIKVFI